MILCRYAYLTVGYQDGNVISFGKRAVFEQADFTNIFNDIVKKSMNYSYVKVLDFIKGMNKTSSGSRMKK